MPKLIEIIIEKEHMDEIVAIEQLYNSKLYELLADEDTWVWHYSPLMLYTMWKSEKETGEIEFPEGQS
ncbi:MAG: hypothetical protein J5691_02350 [Bacilli bacterium]|nr:hypothetical protein [Bacilli bacterium]